MGRLLDVDAAQAQARLQSAGAEVAALIGAVSLPDFSAVSDVVEVEIAAIDEIRDRGTVRVTIRARANGILLGTSTDVTVTEVVPFEEFRP